MWTIGLCRARFTAYSLYERIGQLICRECKQDGQSHHHQITRQPTFVVEAEAAIHLVKHDVRHVQLQGEAAQPAHESAEIRSAFSASELIQSGKSQGPNVCPSDAADRVEIASDDAVQNTQVADVDECDGYDNGQRDPKVLIRERLLLVNVFSEPAADNEYGNAREGDFRSVEESRPDASEDVVHEQRAQHQDDTSDFGVCALGEQEVMDIGISEVQDDDQRHEPHAGVVR